jgi:hypothetical protein
MASSAMGVIFASEIWSVDPDYITSIGFEAAQKEMNEWKGGLDKHPHRIEGIWMTLEHHRLTGSITWFARITRDDQGKPTLGEWKEERWPQREGKGRFLHMLPPVN